MSPLHVKLKLGRMLSERGREIQLAHLPWGCVRICAYTDHLLWFSLFDMVELRSDGICPAMFFFGEGGGK